MPPPAVPAAAGPPFLQAVEAAAVPSLASRLGHAERLSRELDEAETLLRGAEPQVRWCKCGGVGHTGLWALLRRCRRWGRGASGTAKETVTHMRMRGRAGGAEGERGAGWSSRVRAFCPRPLHLP